LKMYEMFSQIKSLLLFDFWIIIF